MISSTNLIGIYLTIELLNFCVYILIIAKKNSVKTVEASMRYYTYSSYASAIFLLGMSLTYGLFGTVDLTVLHMLTMYQQPQINIIGSTILEGQLLYYVACLALVLPIIFKLGLVPLHF